MKVTKVLAVLLLSVFVLTTAGCANVVSKEYSEVEVTIVDKYHRAAYPQVIPCGKGFMVVNHPAVYEITVEYNGDKYTLNDSSVYYKYHDQIGKTVTAEVEIKTYDNGNVTMDIVRLKG